MDPERERKIRERAYAIWERKGRPEGSAEEHWQEAERELEAEEERKEEQATGPSAAAGSRRPRSRKGTGSSSK